MQKSFYDSAVSAQKDISDKRVTIYTDHSDAPLKLDLNIVECEEVIKLETADSHMSRLDSSDDDDIADKCNFWLKSFACISVFKVVFLLGEMEKSIADEDECSNNEQKGDDNQVIPPTVTRIDVLRPPSEKTEMEGEIHEFFNMNCELCNDVEFETLLKAKQHYRKVHQTKGYITCCGKKFFHRHRIVKHVRLHINPDAYHCDQCNKSFVDEKALKGHIDNHLPLDSRKFKCNLCRSGFTREYQLKVHVRLKHTAKTGEKFPCDKCGKK